MNRKGAEVIVNIVIYFSAIMVVVLAWVWASFMTDDVAERFLKAQDTDMEETYLLLLLNQRHEYYGKSHTMAELISLSSKDQVLKDEITLIIQNYFNKRYDQHWELTAGDDNRNFLRIGDGKVSTSPPKNQWLIDNVLKNELEPDWKDEDDPLTASISYYMWENDYTVKLESWVRYK